MALSALGHRARSFSTLRSDDSPAGASGGSKTKSRCETAGAPIEAAAASEHDCALCHSSFMPLNATYATAAAPPAIEAAVAARSLAAFWAAGGHTVSFSRRCFSE